MRLLSRDGERRVRLADFYRPPGDTPQVENDLRPGELITEVIVPRLSWARRSAYVKVRDRQSYEFALASAAVALDLRGGIVRDARVAVGGVGTVPWRLPAVEAALHGGPATEQHFTAAAERAADGARPLAAQRLQGDPGDNGPSVRADSWGCDDHSPRHRRPRRRPLKVTGRRRRTPPTTTPTASRTAT